MPWQFTTLTSNPLHVQFLIVCDHCVGIGFKTRNKSQRTAVKYLMQARHHIGRLEFNQIVRELLAADVIEEVPGRGSTAFKLTYRAKLVLRGDAETLEEAATHSSSEESKDA